MRQKYLVFGLCIETDIDFNDVLTSSDASVDVTILEKDEIRYSSLQATNLARKGIFARIGIEGESVVLHWPDTAIFEIRKGAMILYQNLGSDPGTLRLFLLSEVIGIILFQRNYLLLHGSAVLNNAGKALLFLGKSGAGKSTTAAAFGKSGCAILTDDLVALKASDTGTCLTPGFNQFKIWEKSIHGLKLHKHVFKPSFEGARKYAGKQEINALPEGDIPVEKIWCLETGLQSEHEYRTDCNNASLLLLNHFALPSNLLKGHYLRQHFDDTQLVVKQIPVYRRASFSDFGTLEKWVSERLEPVAPL